MATSSGPLLATKLHVPRPRLNLVPRPRLTGRLSEGLTGRLILIAAPAGFGKTTLVSEWLAPTPAAAGRERGAGVRAAWLSLDDDDNDPARFLTYLVAALAAALQPGLGEDALAMLRSPQPQPAKAVLNALVNDLGPPAGPLLLVLDDYHVITGQPIHDAVAFLLEHLPAHVRLVILTRADPPLPIARLRARGQLVEIRAADLRFMPDEAAAFLNQIMGLRLSLGDIAAL